MSIAPAPAPPGRPGSAPVPVVVARVAVSLQLLTAALLTAAGAVYGSAAAASDRAARAAGDANPFSGLGTALGIAAAVVGVVLLVALGLPLWIMAGRSAARRQTGRGLLVGVQLMLFAVGLLLTGNLGFGGSFGPAVFAWVAVTLVAVGCLLTPATSRWAAAGRL